MPLEATLLQVQMLDGFSLRRGGTKADIGSRSRKLCLLLACLIWERRRPIPVEELTGLLWEKPEPGSLNSLKALIHRARVCLDRLGEGLGRTLLLNRKGGYQWNQDFPMVLDAEEFQRLCQEASDVQDEAHRLSLETRALALYRGEFLPSLARYPWAAALQDRLHRQYLQTMLDTLPRLAAGEQWQEALLLLNRCQDAARLYENLQEQLLTRMGVLPSDQLRELYRQSQRDQDPRAVTPVTLLERLQEPPSSGALICEYDFFCILCRSMARMAGRSGEPLHVALISITGPEAPPMPRHSLDRAMDNLQEIILGHLRRGDTAARCSASQFVLLLPQVSYKNGQMICARITRAFSRQFPHSPAVLQVSVQPLLSSMD